MRRLAPLLCASCVAAPPASGPRALTEVVEAPGATGAGFGDPDRAVNGVRGAGATQGSLDVYTVGPEGLVLGTGGVPVLDRDGTDLVVFENAFTVDGGGTFVDPAVVEASPDCVDFTAFSFAYDGGATFDPEPARWIGFAGLAPVFLNLETAPVDPFGPTAGGDAFDLADLDAGDPVAEDVLRNGLLCVRIRPASAFVDPATGAPFATEPIANGPDIDGVWVR